MLDWRAISVARAASYHREQFNKISRRADDLARLHPAFFVFVETVGLMLPYIYHGFLAVNAERCLKQLMKNSQK